MMIIEIDICGGQKSSESGTISIGSIVGTSGKRKDRPSSHQGRPSVKVVPLPGALFSERVPK
jgi:hypothetical protein